MTKMSYLAKDNDVLQILDDYEVQSMLTVCSLTFLVLSTIRVQNFASRNVCKFWPHSQKLIPAKKNLKSMTRES